MDYNGPAGQGSCGGSGASGSESSAQLPEPRMDSLQEICDAVSSASLSSLQVHYDTMYCMTLYLYTHAIVFAYSRTVYIWHACSDACDVKVARRQCASVRKCISQ
jgi:hypothetical protein